MRINFHPKGGFEGPTRRESVHIRAKHALPPFGGCLNFFRTSKRQTKKQWMLVLTLGAILLSLSSRASSMSLFAKSIGEHASLPIRGSKYAAGVDLSSACAVVVPAHGKAIVQTNLAIATPLDCYARIAPRSGLAWKSHIDVGAGVVDADYRGNVGVILFNHGDNDFAVEPGDRVAQLILEKVDMATVTAVTELPDTARGEGGFGSTGVSDAVAQETASTPAAEASSIAGGSLLVKRLTEAAVLPVRGSAFAAGFDLSSAYDVVVPAHGKAIVKTDLAVATPLDCYARIAPRSGLAWKSHIDVGAGVVDADYRGNVGVILFNHGDSDFAVKPGDRVAQMILQKVDMAAVSEVSELPDTARGEGGFGSTGVSSAVPIDATASKEPETAATTAAEASSIASGSLLVNRLTEAAVLPVRGSAFAAGFDLSSACDVVVPAHGKAIVKTDLAVATPLDCYARIAPRSGLAWKSHIDVGAGVVDADYRGNVGVILFNHGDIDFTVKPGDRVAQMILQRVDMASVTEVQELPDTARGEGGFGSTGVSGIPEPDLKRPKPEVGSE